MKPLAPRVLIVEDDQDIRQTIVEMLNADGLEVGAAADGLAAIEMLDKTDFDLIVTDVQLGGDVDGLDTVRCARMRQPSLRSLFISGQRQPTTEDPQADEFIAKPFRPRELLGCVRELLQRDPPRRAWIDPARLAERCMAVARVDCLRQRRRTALAAS